MYHFLLPSLCLLCGFPTKNAYNLCEACQKNLPILPHHCLQCGQILAGQPMNIKCGACLTNPPPFRQIYALFQYQTPIMQMITRLKFQERLDYAQAFSELLRERVLHHWYHKKPLPQVLLPVPLHPKRLRERGYNQALEIARGLADLIPIDVTGIKRVKNTQPQTQLSALKRKQNIAQAFVSSCDYTGRSIAVIDDVITTGQTVLELCRVLKKNGADNIDVWCCARRT